MTTSATSGETKNAVLIVAAQLIKQHKISLTTKSLEQSIQNHPDFPSLFSLTESLTKWGIDSQALQLRSEQIDEMQTPFVAYLRRKIPLVLVTEIDQDTVSFLSHKGLKKTISRTEFNNSWLSVVVTANPRLDAGEKDFITKKTKERISALKIPILLAVTSLFILVKGFTIPAGISVLQDLIILLIPLAGIVITGVLLNSDVSNSDSLVEKLCDASDQTGCNKVLHSAGAKIFNLLTLGELAFFYFSGTLLLLLVSNEVTMTIRSLAILNLLAIPVCIFSVIYQWLIVKTWCKICLMIISIVLCNFTAYYFIFWRSFISSSDWSLWVFTTSFLVSSALIFLLPVLFWFFFKETLVASYLADGYKQELSRFKYNTTVFNGLLSQQKIIATNADLGIIIGNENPKHTITMISNPYCEPCSEAHRVVSNLMKKNAEINLQIIFVGHSRYENDPGDLPVKHFMWLYDKDKNSLENVLNHWYDSEIKDYEKFAASYNTNGLGQYQINKLKDMKDWCDTIGVNYTPTFFINGRQLPKFYSIQDIQFFL